MTDCKFDDVNCLNKLKEIGQGWCKEATPPDAAGNCPLLECSSLLTCDQSYQVAQREKKKRAAQKILNDSEAELKIAEPAKKDAEAEVAQRKIELQTAVESKKPTDDALAKIRAAGAKLTTQTDLIAKLNANIMSAQTTIRVADEEIATIQAGPNPPPKPILEEEAEKQVLQEEE